MYRKPALKTKFGERVFSHAGLLPGTVCQSIFSLSQTPNISRNFSNLPVYIVILTVLYIQLYFAKRQQTQK